ncbi:MAG: protein translocase subunit SecD [Actinomycetia bacterium]|nr:protein translocase subunit SecD [Actinomycetes bacterium]
MTPKKAWITLILTLAIAWGSLAAMLAVGWAPKLGLDLQGGFAVTLVAPDGTDENTLNTAADIMRRRIENLGGVQEPEVAVVSGPGGEASIIVQLPGVDDRERALQAVGTTGELSFRAVLAETTESLVFLNPEGEHPEGTDETTGLAAEDDVNKPAYLAGQDDLLVYAVDGIVVDTPAGTTVVFPTGRDITDATAQFSSQGLGGQWVVVPEFTDEGGEKFREATGYLANFPPGSPQRQLAIVVDGVVFSAPAVANTVTPEEGLDPDAVIITVGTAENSEDEAKSLAAILRYGALPTTFERESVYSVSATLGADSLRAGLIAGLVGLALVAMYMLVYYRSMGIISIVGLTVFGSFLLGSLILLGETQGTTLTLAGVTGIIVSVGITSDSYIVYFERIKEEFRHGRSLTSAITHGFSGAYRTILTGDTVTFLGAILLFVLATGQVKGFALTLGLATVIDVFVAYFYTRPATFLMGRGPLGQGGLFSVRGAMGGGEIVEVKEPVEVSS